MIPNERALVPLRPERLAAVRAIVFVEQKRATQPGWGTAPYARAFFRFLTGKGKVCWKNIERMTGYRYARPDRHGTLDEWERSIDVFLSSRGRVCPLPLPDTLTGDIFPDVLFSRRERDRRRSGLSAEQFARQSRREDSQATARYQNLVARAEIDLAFQTPSTLRAWYAHWSQLDIHDHDLDRMMWSWTTRFPSLRQLERWQFRTDAPSWHLEAEIREMARASGPAEQAMNVWLIPNKLTERAA
ncbi:hypothetical protein PMPD1_4430 (plasmid) [Paramixta manurensis]|uniref:Plasmid SOS inhibition protein A n=1 Tax=Paramixta manurensis TaxID=2740817 RepID=A0A6M8UF20_9GAMM|nr:hypothetical protein PMPD1_4430 [Erwiniaceae bacterium PD-1]